MRAVDRALSVLGGSRRSFGSYADGLGDGMRVLHRKVGPFFAWQAAALAAVFVVSAAGALRR